MQAVYEVDGDSVRTNRWAAGPWDPTMQHGAAPAALTVWAAEKLPAQVPMETARLTIDLMRPVPVGPLRIAAQIVRDGRKIQLCDIRLFSDQTEVVRATVLKIRALTSDRETPKAPEQNYPGPEESGDPGPMGMNGNPFLSGMSLRVAKGGFLVPGPGAIWFRSDRQMIAGETTSPAMRAAIAADFMNGVSSVLDFRAWTFLNADLSVSLARQPVGEWILVDAETWIGECSRGVAFARLADQQGYFGRAVQSLVLEERQNA
jgi:hypothetical protein